MTGFAKWVEKHATMFGITSDPELKTMLSWEPVFRGVSVVLLTEATMWLANHPEEFATCDVRFYGKMVAHLRLLKGFVFKQSRRSVEAVVVDTGPPADPKEWFRLRSTMKECFGKLPAKAKEEWAGRKALEKILQETGV